MPTLANDLVQFLMQLFGNREAIQEFLDDPERALQEHGLANVCSADVDAAMPVVLDYAPITLNALSFVRGNAGSVWPGSAGGSATHAGNAPAIHAGGVAAGYGGANYDHDDHAHAVQQLQNVVNHFSYTTQTTMLDDRDTITDQSVSQNIWAHGDVEQWFDNHAAVASGDRAVAAGDDAAVRDSNNVRDSYNTDHSTDNSTDNSVHAGGDASIGTEETDISGSFNTDLGLDVDDSFNDSSDNSYHPDYSDHSVSTDMDLEARDSFNDNSSTNNSVEVDDSYNQDSSTTTAVEVHVDDSFQDNPATSIVEDNLVVADNQLDFTEDNSTHSDVDVDNHAVIDDAVVDDSTAL